MTASFAYQVRDPRGNLHEGVIDAATADDASQQLRRDGFQVLQLTEEESSSLGLFPRSVKRTELVYVTNQLAVMVDTGIPLAIALQGIEEQEQNPTLKHILKQIRNEVEQGQDFSAALAKHPKLFDKTYISLIRASEATGALGPMLERIADYQRKELESRAKVKAAMAYPVVMLVLAIGITIFLLTFVMPKFAPMFVSKGIDLPKPTIVAMAISNSLINYWYLWIVGIIGSIVGFIQGRKTEVGRQFWDRVKISVPLMGPMNRKIVISRSIRTLGTMLSSGIPMLDALKLSSDVAGNHHYEKLWREVSERVMAGEQICETLRGNPLFPQMLVQMISAGEQTGQLGKVLERVSNYYEQEVETSLKAVTSIIEPLLIVVMGGVVGTIGMAMMLPIFSLSKSGGEGESRQYAEGSMQLGGGCHDKLSAAFVLTAYRILHSAYFPTGPRARAWRDGCGARREGGRGGGFRWASRNTLCGAFLS